MVYRIIKNNKKMRLIPLASGVLLFVLFGVAVYRLFYQARTVVNSIVVEHIAQLGDIFKKINDTCVITDVTQPVNHINFLTVKSFVGSEIGPLNLAYPKEWRGPYLKDNPSIQGHVYEIVKTKQGYYIVPGMGVQLTNGKVMGKDIVITPDTDMHALIEKGTLRHDGKALAIPLPMKGSIAIKPIILPVLDA